MTALIIVGSILLLILLLLCAPLSARLRVTEDGTSIRLRFLFFRYDLVPEALLEKAARPKDAEQPEKAEAKPGKKAKKKPSFADIWALIKSSRRGLAAICRHLVFSRVRVYISVAGGDAHRTAVLFGQLSALTAVSVEIVDSLFVLKKPDIVILPDFLAEKTRYEVSFRVQIRVLFLLVSATGILLRFLKTLTRRGDEAPSKPARQN